MEKTCTKCHETKPRSMFSPRKPMKQGRDTHIAWCKACTAAKSHADYLKNPKLAASRSRESAARRRLEDPVTHYVRQMYNAAKKRAKQSGISFTIAIGDITPNVCCPILGTELRYASKAEGKKGPRPNSPSLDRLNPQLGYVPGNVMVISIRANAIKNDATPEELMKVAQFVSVFV